MNSTETVVKIPIARLRPFPDHPFYVRDDEMMLQLVESIRQVGVLVPAIVRKTDDGFYQLISGHRRAHACECLELDELPCIVRDTDEYERKLALWENG